MRSFRSLAILFGSSLSLLCLPNCANEEKADPSLPASSNESSPGDGIKAGLCDEKKLAICNGFTKETADSARLTMYKNSAGKFFMGRQRADFPEKYTECLDRINPISAEQYNRIKDAADFVRHPIASLSAYDFDKDRVPPKGLTIDICYDLVCYKPSEELEQKKKCLGKKYQNLLACRASFIAFPKDEDKNARNSVLEQALVPVPKGVNLTSASDCSNLCD